jgi:hypothetical protein
VPGQNGTASRYLTIEGTNSESTICALWRGFVTMIYAPTDPGQIRSAPTADEVPRGWRIFGHFVNDTTHLKPSTFDDFAAMPTLLALLPTLTDRNAVQATARHLGRSWAKPTTRPSANKPRGR